MKIYNVVTTGYHENEGYFTEIKSFKTEEEAFEHISKIRKIYFSYLVNNFNFETYRVVDDHPDRLFMHGILPEYLSVSTEVTTIEEDK